MKNEEKRIMNSIEVRANQETEKMVIGGYALKFNTWSEDLGGFKETISSESLKDTNLDDVRCLVDHEPSQILGRSTSGTLNLEVDETGLKFECTLPNTTLARDIYENIKLGNVNQCSFGFILNSDGDEWMFDVENDIYMRTLTNFKELTDVSVVTYPAYRDTDVAPALRSIKELNDEFEHEKVKLELELL
ncbi:MULTISPECIES: HK97 family phage prohead protease [Mammaliicoccus]|uniref:HK97 family phage prohead protease n=1 Tax=Mammaliicoccus sp. JADD-157 TaxID=3404818 RepID=UPI0028E5C6FB|nr:HK97 family phage prohead protease [Mammaliicoccus lentus]